MLFGLKGHVLLFVIIKASLSSGLTAATSTRTLGRTPWCFPTQLRTTSPTTSSSSSPAQLFRVTRSSTARTQTGTKRRARITTRPTSPSCRVSGAGISSSDLCQGWVRNTCASCVGRRGRDTGLWGSSFSSRNRKTKRSGGNGRKRPL